MGDRDSTREDQLIEGIQASTRQEPRFKATEEPAPPKVVTRRQALALAACISTQASQPALGLELGALAQLLEDQFDRTPAKTAFDYGVASGDPLEDAVIIWTCVSGQPQRDSIEIGWEFASDPEFRQIVASGRAIAQAQSAYTVHIDVTNLNSSRWYWYRFNIPSDQQSGIKLHPASDRAGKDLFVSRVGKTRTAPSKGAIEPLRLGLGSCQHWEWGYFGAWDMLRQMKPDLVFFAGDYIYESAAPMAVRRHRGGVPLTLDEFRQRYKQYRLDPSLQAMHADAPWVIIWDDHELINDYAGVHAPKGESDFLPRRLYAYQAWAEFMPIRQPKALQVARRIIWGKVADILLLDTRQHKDLQACAEPGGARRIALSKDCGDRYKTKRSMLGKAQELWAQRQFRQMAEQSSQWPVIAQTTLISPALDGHGKATRYWSDGWDGYPFARSRLLSDAVLAGLGHLLVIGGDVHTALASDLPNSVVLDYIDPSFSAEQIRIIQRKLSEHPNIASEWTVGGISRRGWDEARVAGRILDNPHLRWGDGRPGSFALLHLSMDKAQIEFFALEDTRTKGSSHISLSRWQLDAGKPTMQRI